MHRQFRQITCMINAIRNLPSCYDGACKEKVIIEHSRRMKLFGLRSLIKARSIGAYNSHLYKKYKIDLSSHSGLRPAILLMVAFIPRAIIKDILAIKTNLLRKK